MAIWKICSRAEAIEVLRGSRARLTELIADLDDDQFKARTLLGGGAWSAKDLLGHLASVEESALRFITGAKPRYAGRSASVDEINAAEIERKRRWSPAKVREDSQRIHRELVSAIETMDDARWTSKVQVGSGRSALALVIGRVLVGGKHGLFAHDLAHMKDLERSVASLRRK